MKLWYDVYVITNYRCITHSNKIIENALKIRIKYPEKICQSMYFLYIKLLYFSVKLYFTIVVSRSHFFFFRIHRICISGSVSKIIIPIWRLLSREIIPEGVKTFEISYLLDWCIFISLISINNFTEGWSMWISVVFLVTVMIFDKTCPTVPSLLYIIHLIIFYLAVKKKNPLKGCISISTTF